MVEYDRIDISKGIDVNKKMHQENVIFVIIGTLKILVLNINHMNHGLMQKAMNLNDIAIASVKGSDYRIHFWYMSKNDAINIMKNSNLNEKRVLL